ncbi:LBP_cg2779 family protein [Lentilactobacillus kribbianus]|uniref:LBP_cg2779 family protein n=1 Tax=Lentilactobacillus kribbianus TaxID=2729622 RepID=UPI001555F6BC|nr:LBP_cg2779 family protein [Lentilactobacillus kribbianus]
MADHFSNLAEEIIDFQKKHDLTDTQLAFNIHMSVERLHDIKSMEVNPTKEEQQSIEAYVR